MSEKTSHLRYLKFEYSCFSQSITSGRSGCIVEINMFTTRWLYLYLFVPLM